MEQGRVTSLLHKSRPAHRTRTHGNAWRKIGVWFWVLVCGVCLVKLLVLVPQSRVVFVGAESEKFVPQSTRVYAQEADRLFRTSPLNRNKISVDSRGIAKKLQMTYPELQQVVVTVPIVGSRPVVYLTLGQPVLRLESSNGSYLLSKSGHAYQGATAATTLTLPKVIDASNVRTEKGRPVLPASTVSFISTLAYQLERGNISVETFVLPARAPYEVMVRVTGKSYVLRVNLQAPVLEQSGAAIATLAKLGSSEPKEYLDLRVMGRAYYK